MSLARFVTATATAVGALLAFTAARPAPASANVAEKYFGCPTGYTFQTSSNVARCYLAGKTSTANIVCGVGFVKALDQFNGGRDACQNITSNVVGNYTCPAGFSPKVQPGPDLCLKQGTASIIAPSVEKSI